MPPKAGRPAGKPKGSKDVSPFFLAAVIGILSAWNRASIPLAKGNRGFPGAATLTRWAEDICNDPDSLAEMKIKPTWPLYDLAGMAPLTLRKCLKPVAPQLVGTAGRLALDELAGRRWGRESTRSELTENKCSRGSDTPGGVDRAAPPPLRSPARRIRQLVRDKPTANAAKLRDAFYLKVAKKE
eukprot:gene5045-21593_t